MNLKESQNISKRWFSCPKPNNEARMRLFCFPYGGGGRAIYDTWPKNLPPFVEVYSAQLPGHGQRYSEPLITHMPTLVEMLTQATLPFLDRPFVFFGHSMGAVICFEVARNLRRKQRQEPRYLFVSGHGAPQIPKTTPWLHEQSDSEFIKELNNLGTAKDLLDHAELLELLLPVIRADYQLIETYIYTREPPLTCPIMAFGGTEDKTVPREHLDKWKEQTASEFGVRMFNGSHFFIHSEESVLLSLIYAELNRFS
jgi:medium-chain acyl-[acyl-carrier-protein] hydrolase